MRERSNLVLGGNNSFTALTDHLVMFSIAYCLAKLPLSPGFISLVLASRHNPKAQSSVSFLLFVPALSYHVHLALACSYSGSNGVKLI